MSKKRILKILKSSITSSVFATERTSICNREDNEVNESRNGPCDQTFYGKKSITLFHYPSLSQSSLTHINEKSFHLADCLLKLQNLTLYYMS